MTAVKGIYCMTSHTSVTKLSAATMYTYLI